MGIATFFGIVFCIYLITKPINEAIQRLHNIINLLDKRIKKLENAVFHTQNPYSDE